MNFECLNVETLPGTDAGTHPGKPVITVTPDGPGYLSVDAVIRQHHRHLISWLRNKLYSPEDAQDIAQEAYIRLLKYEGTCDIRSARAMLQQIAINVARGQGRARRCRYGDQHYSLDGIEIDSLEPPLERMIEARQNLARVIHAIENLSAKCRRVFLLSRVDGMSYPEIAAHCNISVKMVEKHISHALLICARSLPEEARMTAGGSGLIYK